MAARLNCDLVVRCSSPRPPLFLPTKGTGRCFVSWTKGGLRTATKFDRLLFFERNSNPDQTRNTNTTTLITFFMECWTGDARLARFCD